MSTPDLRRRLIHCELPRVPGDINAQGTVLVQILVMSDGTVGCIRIITGHPLLREAAMVALRKWTFRPLIVKGNGVPMLGLVPVLVSRDTDKMTRHCMTSEGLEGM